MSDNNKVYCPYCECTVSVDNHHVCDCCGNYLNIENDDTEVEVIEVNDVLIKLHNTLNDCVYTYTHSDYDDEAYKALHNGCALIKFVKSLGIDITKVENWFNEAIETEQVK